MQRIDRMVRQLVSQDVARTNAATAYLALRKRRDEQEDADAYLTALGVPVTPVIGDALLELELSGAALGGPHIF